MNERRQQLIHWLGSLGYPADGLAPASEDASFRRYYRVLRPGGGSCIVMDAPPDKEPLTAFVDIDRRLRAAGLSAPEILAHDDRLGFLLMEDFGGTHYLDVLDADNAPELYGDALEAILRMQSDVDTDGLPPYDESLLRTEMALFRDWFLERLLGIELTPNQVGAWKLTVDELVRNALQQPRAFVHRDCHSRNLMYLKPMAGERRNPGILDFQDAVIGPITYDLVSLLRDCYIAWPEAQVDDWVRDFHAAARPAGIDMERFLRDFDLMGAQRHLKAIGIFARLHLRDGKDGYLKDIPRTLDYLKIVATRQGLAGLFTLINELSLGFRIRQVTGAAAS